MLIGRLIQQILVRQGGQGRLAMQSVCEAYLRIADDRLARRTRVTGLRAGLVTIEADSSALAYELHGFLGAQILEKLRAEPGAENVRRIRFVVGAGSHD